MTDVLAQATTDTDLFLVVVTLVGGLAIFLLGLDRLTESLRLVAGDRMRGALRRLTGNRFSGMATGIGVTAAIQSSSVTTVLVVGLIAGGVMTFHQSLGVILGAGVGGTVTAQIIAFDVGRYALLLVAAGFGVTFVARRSDRRAWGTLVMGLGLIFFGMTLMGEAMEPLRDEQGFVEAMARMEAPLIGALAGAVFTALVQTSAATVGIVIVLAAQGIISPEAGLALVIGANVGTSVTAILASIGKPREAVRAAVAHTLIKVAGAAVWLPLIGVLGDLVGAVGGSPGRQVANAHTLFNVANAVLFLGVTTPFARLVERLVPETFEPSQRVEAKYLDASLLRTPTLALDRARLELLRMANRTKAMVETALPAVLSGDRISLGEVEEMDDDIDHLHGAITAYLGRISEQRLSVGSTEEMLSLMDAANDLESIGDIVETNLVGLGLERLDQGVVISPATRRVLEGFHERVVAALDLARMAVTQKNREAADEVAAMKDTINALEQSALAHQAERLVADEPLRIPTYRFEVDVLSNLKRIYYHAKRIARVAVPRRERPDL